MNWYEGCLIVALFMGAQVHNAESPCDATSLALDSQDPEVFEKALQSVLDNKCDGLLPRVADLFKSSKCPARFHAADVLALSGDKKYGPLLIRYFYEASAGIQEFASGSLVYQAILACSDLPRGTNLFRVNEYASVPPRLDGECLSTYRKLLEGHYDDDGVAVDAMALLKRTATPEAIDIIERCYMSSDPSVRAEAVVALQHLPLEISFPLFERAINDPYRDARFQVVRLLLNHKDQRVSALFEKRLPTETDERLISLMKNYLQKCTGG